MLMCEQMILTVFVIALALGAETEFQRRIVEFRPAADSITLCFAPPAYPCGLRISAFELLPSVHLVRRIALEVSGGEEENNKVEERHKNRHSSRPSGLKKLKAIRTPYTAAIHFILIGIMNIRRTCISGTYIHANARKMDMLM